MLILEKRAARTADVHYTRLISACRIERGIALVFIGACCYIVNDFRGVSLADCTRQGSRLTSLESGKERGMEGQR